VVVKICVITLSHAVIHKQCALYRPGILRDVALVESGLVTFEQKALAGLYDTSSHAFEVQINTSSHGGRGAVAVSVFSSAWEERFTFIGLFISLRIVKDIDLVDWANLSICLCM